MVSLGMGLHREFGVINQSMKEQPKFHSADRVQDSLLASPERSVLRWLAEHTPAWVNSDHFTAIGFLAQVMAGVSYALARGGSLWLLGTVISLMVNWLGDSLDGTLARFRNQQRPRYGFYVDHMLDSLGAVCLMGGLACSGYINPWIATGMLVAFLLLSIQSYLAAHVLGEFRLSFWRFGPTEVRVLLAIGTLALYRWPVVLKGHYRLFDIGGAISLAGMTIMLLIFTAKNIYRLYKMESFPLN